MKKYIYYVAGAIIVFFAGFLSARHTTPVTTIVQEKEVVKENKDNKTVVKRVKTPDGTVTTEITKEDKTSTSSDKSNTQIVINEKYWKASITTNLNSTYGISLERRISGPFFVGGWINTNKEAGISVGIEF